MGNIYTPTANTSDALKDIFTKALEKEMTKEEGRLVIIAEVLRARFIFRKRFPFIFYYQLIAFQVHTDEGWKKWASWLSAGDRMEVRDDVQEG